MNRRCREDGCDGKEEQKESFHSNAGERSDQRVANVRNPPHLASPSRPANFSAPFGVSCWRHTGGHGPLILAYITLYRVLLEAVLDPRNKDTTFKAY